MDKNQLIQQIEQQIKDHIHDGNFSQRINLFDIFGNIQTVTSSPLSSPAPKNIYDQFQIYSGILYYYSFGDNTWYSITTVVANQIGGMLFVYNTDVGNVTTGETTLYTDSVSGTSLSGNKDMLSIEYGGVFVSSGTATRQLRLYFGGTQFFDTGALTLSLSSAWTIYATITRVSATVVRTMVSMTTEGAALAAYTSYSEITGLTLSSGNILKITGQAAGVGAASGDITAKLGFVELKKAP